MTAPQYGHRPYYAPPEGIAIIGTGLLVKVGV